MGPWKRTAGLPKKFTGTSPHLRYEDGGLCFSPCKHEHGAGISNREELLLNCRRQEAIQCRYLRFQVFAGASVLCYLHSCVRFQFCFCLCRRHWRPDRPAPIPRFNQPGQIGGHHTYFFCNRYGVPVFSPKCYRGRSRDIYPLIRR